MMDISETIKTLRKKQGMTQAELAEKVGIAKMSLLRYEKGERTPNAATLVSIANALGVSPSALLPAGGDVMAEDLLALVQFSAAAVDSPKMREILTLLQSLDDVQLVQALNVLKALYDK